MNKKKLSIATEESLYSKAVVKLADLVKNSITIEWHLNHQDKKEKKILSAIEQRLAIPKLLEWHATIMIERLKAGEYYLSGFWSARLCEICVITLEEFETSLRHDVSIDFIDGALYDEKKHQDYEPVVGERLDIFDQLIQELSLHRDPFPKKSGARLLSNDDAPAKKPTHRPFYNLSAMLDKKNK